MTAGAGRRARTVDHPRPHRGRRDTSRRVASCPTPRSSTPPPPTPTPWKRLTALPIFGGSRQRRSAQVVGRTGRARACDDPPPATEQQTGPPAAARWGSANPRPPRGWSGPRRPGRTVPTGFGADGKPRHPGCGAPAVLGLATVADTETAVDEFLGEAQVGPGSANSSSRCWPRRSGRQSTSPEGRLAYGDLVPLLLGPALRHVGDTTALIWVQTESASTVEVLGCSASTFEVQGHHFALVPVTNLTPDTITEYQVMVDGDAGLAARGLAVPAERDPYPRAGVRAPAAGHLRIVPVPKDRSPEDRVQTRARRARQLRHRMAGRAIDEWPDALILLGDQLYADELPRRSGDGSRPARG